MSAVCANLDEVLSMRKGIQGKLARLADLYEDGMIDREEYRQKRDKLREDLERMPEPEQAHEVTLPEDRRITVANLGIIKEQDNISCSASGIWESNPQLNLGMIDHKLYDFLI